MRGLILLVALVALCAGLAQTSQGHVLLSDVGLYEQPASYTELSFTSPGDLPSSLVRPNSPIDVSFGIRNASGAPREYQWSIVLTKLTTVTAKASATAKASDTAKASATASASATANTTAKASGATVKASGTVTAPAQGRATVTKSVAMTCAGGQLEVQARLADPAESIDFYVACPASAK